MGLDDDPETSINQDEEQQQQIQPAASPNQEHNLRDPEDLTNVLMSQYLATESS